MLIERQLRDGQGEGVLVLRAPDLDLHGEGRVAELLIVAVESSGNDGAVGAVDVLLVGKQVGPTDVDDADSVGGLAIGLGQELEVVVRFLDQVFAVFFVRNDPRVLREGDNLIGAEAVDEKRVEEDGRTKIFEAITGWLCDLTVASHREVAPGNPELPGFAIADHIERDRTEKGDAEQDAEVLRLSEKDVAAEAGVLGFLALAATTSGGDDLDGGVHGLDGIEAVVDLLEEIGEFCVEDDVRGTCFGDDAGMGQAARERRSQPNDCHRHRLSYPHEHKLQVYLSRPCSSYQDVTR